MQGSEIVSRLEGFSNRGAGTDAERRAAGWLAEVLSANGRDVILETFWCRPSWALAQAWHVALGIAGSLLSVASPIAGVSLLAIAFVSLVGDALTGVSLGRRLTRERASQNVIVLPAPANDLERTRLILTANYDAGRVGLAYRDGLRGVSGLLRRAVRGVTPGWLGWLSIALVWLLAIAVLRLEGHTSHTIGAIQLPPTVGLVLAFALLLELATADHSPAAGDNASGVAAASALLEAVEAAPMPHLDVELVLTGAGDRDQIGLRRYLRARRRDRRAANTVVLGVAPCSGGDPRWWTSDGALLPIRYTRVLRGLARTVASEESHLAAKPHRGRGSTQALPARKARLPAITFGCLDGRELVPRSHQRDDVAAALDARSLERAVQFGLLLIDEIDATVAEGQARPSPTPA